VITTRTQNQVGLPSGSHVRACVYRPIESCLLTPDGKPLYTNLDLSFAAERTGLVGRNGVGKTTLLRLIAGAAALHGGTISVQGRLAVLRQTVQPDRDETIADLFGVTEALAMLARAEAGQATAEDLAAADWTLEARIAAALGRLGLEARPVIRHHGA
jgi:ATPase subunit of ABC transporter with duplicated ATPase domains